MLRVWNKIIQISNFLFGIFSWRVPVTSIESVSKLKVITIYLHRMKSHFFSKRNCGSRLQKIFFVGPIHNLKISRTTNFKRDHFRRVSRRSIFFPRRIRFLLFFFDVKVDNVWYEVWEWRHFADSSIRHGERLQPRLLLLNNLRWCFFMCCQ